ncbi:MAG TPA: HEPN domain-containing protein [Thermoleophilaceae bacterium]|nr:HEPN domain-containing protein [Thermoleophilaceae bacterium]
MSPKPKKDLAREHIQTALEDYERGSENDAVNALFYAAEAAVVALADYHGINTQQRHNLKADAATELFLRKLIDQDFGPLLRELNQARKDIWYEGDEPDFEDGLEDVIAQVEELVSAAEEQA